MAVHFLHKYSGLLGGVLQFIFKHLLQASCSTIRRADAWLERREVQGAGFTGEARDQNEKIIKRICKLQVSEGFTHTQICISSCMRRAALVWRLKAEIDHSCLSCHVCIYGSVLESLYLSCYCPRCCRREPLRHACPI